MEQEVIVKLTKQEIINILANMENPGQVPFHVILPTYIKLMAVAKPKQDEEE